MSARRSFRIRAGALAVLAGLIALACTRQPETATFDNPFDPNGTGGDPFHVTAVEADNSVLVRWRAPEIPDIDNYRILRSLSADSGFSPAGEVAPSANRVDYVFQDTAFARNRVNYYKVRAERDGEQSADSRVASAGVFAPPQIILPNDTLFVRRTLVRVRADAGDSIEVAENADFSPSIRAVLAAGSASVLFDLAATDTLGLTKRVRARVWTSGVAGSPSTATALTGLSATTGFRDTAVVDTTVVVHVHGRGVAAMRAATDSLTSAAPWVVNPDASNAIDTLAIALRVPAGLRPFDIYVELRSDFGFGRFDTLAASPRTVGPASLLVNNGAAVTSDRDVTLTAVAPWATEMRFAETSDFTGVPWQPFAAMSTFELSAPAGPKTVYAIFRNGLDPAGRAATASIELVGGTAP